MGQFFRIQDLGAIAPELELILFGMILLIADLIVPDKKKLGVIAIAGIAVSGMFLWRLNGMDIAAYGGVLVIDRFANFFKILFLNGLRILRRPGLITSSLSG